MFGISGILRHKSSTITGLISLAVSAGLISTGVGGVLVPLVPTAIGVLGLLYKGK